MNSKVDYLIPGEEYKPKEPNWAKIKHYKNVDPTGCELKAHDRDTLMPKPQILKPPSARSQIAMDDITDFPE